MSVRDRVANIDLAAVQRPPRVVFDACRRALVQIGSEHSRCLAVTSSIRGEGRTSIAIALAIAQAQDYRRQVLLLDLDFSRPALSKRLQIDNLPGMTDILYGGQDPDDTVHAIGEGVYAIPGGLASVPVAEAASAVFGRLELVQKLQLRFDGIVADLPPLLESADALIFAQCFERVLLVVRASATSTELVQKAVEGMASPPMAILNDTESKMPGWIRRLTAR
jgi:succinoglycan biosynthesis transport protein ExoP